MSKHSRNFNSIPPRWLGCPRKSLQLLDEKFLIFKTPLSHDYDNRVPDECLFPVDFVFNSMASYKLKLGLWIDLTFTSRFYDKKEVESHGCKYFKLQCRGFGQTPSPEQTQTFIHLCQSFISENPLEIIGVHCTHGFNRSGFMLVSFLVENYGWELGAALLKFAEVRPPGIYKKDYLLELYKKYDDEEFVPEPPPLPNWCYDLRDDKLDDDDNNDNEESAEVNCRDSSSKPKVKRTKVFVKKNPTFMAGVPGVEPVTSSETNIQAEVQRLCEWERTGFPGSQPVSMSVSNLNYLSEKPYTVSWKADGVRYLMYIKKEKEVFFIDRDNSVFGVSNITFPYRKNLQVHLHDTLLDGEMVIDKVNGESRPRFLVYDIISLNGCPIRKEPFFPTRFEAIKKDITNPRYEAMRLRLIDRLSEPFSIRAKDFSDVKYAVKFLSDKFLESLLHEPDGLIFQPAKEPYTPGQYNYLLKWKPATLNTVDFQLKIVVEKRIGMIPKKIGELYVGDLSSRYAVLENVKNLKDLNNKIIECKYENGKWVFMRERTDKSFPNSYVTARNVEETIANPVTQEMLLSFIETSRYVEPMPPPKAPPPHF